MSMLKSSKSTSSYLLSFAKNLMALGYNPTTVKMAVSCTTEFLTHTNQPFEAISPADILKYRAYLQMRPKQKGEGGLTENMINHHIYSLRLFFKYLIEINELVVHPMNTLRFSKATTPQRIVLTITEIQSLYEACENYKEKALLGIYYGCGLRRTEGVRLTIKDVHFKDQLLYIRDGKGGKRRVVPMSGRVADDLKNYILYERYNPNKESALLLNKARSGMSGNSAYELFHELLTRINITKEVSLHNLRHSIATHLLTNGMKVEQVRDFLGHKYLESTQVYTRVLQSV